MFTLARISLCEKSISSSETTFTFRLLIVQRRRDPASSFSTRRWRYDVYERQCKTRIKCGGWKGRTARRDKCKKLIPIPRGNLVISTQNFRQELHNYRGGGVVGTGGGGKRERGSPSLSPSFSPVSMDSRLGWADHWDADIKKSHRHICSIPHSGYSYTLIRNISREDIDIVHYRVLVKALCVTSFPDARERKPFGKYPKQNECRTVENCTNNARSRSQLFT